MVLISFTFGNTLNSKQVTVKGSCMRNAMHGAAYRMGVKECNLVFICIADKLAA